MRSLLVEGIVREGYLTSFLLQAIIDPYNNGFLSHGFLKSLEE